MINIDNTTPSSSEERAVVPYLAPYLAPIASVATESTKTSQFASRLFRLGSGRLVREVGTRLFTPIRNSDPLEAGIWGVKALACRFLERQLGHLPTIAVLSAKVMGYVNTNCFLKRALNAPWEETQALLIERLQVALDPIHVFFRALAFDKVLDKAQEKILQMNGFFSKIFAKKGLNFIRGKNRGLKFFIRSFQKYVEAIQQNPELVALAKKFFSSLENPKERESVKKAFLEKLNAEQAKKSPWMMRLWGQISKERQLPLKKELNKFFEQLNALDQEWLGGVGLENSWMGDVGARGDVVDLFFNSYFPFIFAELDSISLDAPLTSEEIKKFYSSCVCAAAQAVEGIPVLEPLATKVVKPLVEKGVSRLFSSSVEPQSVKSPTFLAKICAKMRKVWKQFKASFFENFMAFHEEKTPPIRFCTLLTKI